MMPGSKILPPASFDISELLAQIICFSSNLRFQPSCYEIGQTVDHNDKYQKHNRRCKCLIRMQSLLGKVIHMNRKCSDRRTKESFHSGFTFGTAATVPAVKISAAVSPTIRPIERITPDKIPGTADGSTVRNTVRSFPAPSPKLPSR